MLGFGGFLGGHLSFRQASGANHAEDVPHLVQPGWQDLCALDELTDDTMQRRLLGGDNDDVPLLVLRQGDAVSVLSDRCSHLSGPLHEGELSDGCIACPWHGSTFRLVRRLGTARARRPPRCRRSRCGCPTAGSRCGCRAPADLRVAQSGQTRSMTMPAGRELGRGGRSLLLEPGRGLVELRQQCRQLVAGLSRRRRRGPRASNTPQARSTGASTSSWWMRRS